jgi:hypothetical protein
MPVVRPAAEVVDPDRHEARVLGSAKDALLEWALEDTGK